jgi:hypothetical protein
LRREVFEKELLNEKLTPLYAELKKGKPIENHLSKVEV